MGWKAPTWIKLLGVCARCVPWHPRDVTKPSQLVAREGCTKRRHTEHHTEVVVVDTSGSHLRQSGSAHISARCAKNRLHTRYVPFRCPVALVLAQHASGA